MLAECLCGGVCVRATVPGNGADSDDEQIANLRARFGHTGCVCAPACLSNTNFRNANDIQI